MIRRCSVLFTARMATRSQWQGFLRALDSCGLEADHFQRPSSEYELSHAPFEAFSPLFTASSFTFRDHQLTTLGDVLIDDYLADRIMHYCLHMGLVLSVNSVKQLNAVFHNHFSMTLFAKELQLDSLALPNRGTLGGTVPGPEDGDASNVLAFLEAASPPPRKRDLNGTSFQIAPLRSGQNPLGWKFSHFIGALHQVYGSSGSTRVLERLYGLTDAGNIPNKASQALVRVLREYPAMNVAEALLAAQGLGLRFVGKTRYLAESNAPPHGRSQQAGSTEREPTSTRTQRSADPPILVSGFSAERHDAAESVSLDTLVSSPADARVTSLVEGPGGLDSQQVWWERTASLVRSRLEPNPTESLEDGWLTHAERRAYEGGPAFANNVDFGPVTHTYADTYGAPNPVDGKIVARRRFSKAVRDPLFYDKLSDMRNGVPFNTDGVPLAEFLDRFHEPHKRLFEVTMLAGGDGGRPVGRAIATRYTTARESACKAYIGGVLNDIRLIQAQTAQTNQ